MNPVVIATTRIVRMCQVGGLLILAWQNPSLIAACIAVISPALIAIAGEKWLAR